MCHILAHTHTHSHTLDSYPTADVGTSESWSGSVLGSVWNLNKLIRCIRHILSVKGEEVLRRAISALEISQKLKVKVHVGHATHGVLDTLECPPECHQPHNHV